MEISQPISAALTGSTEEQGIGDQEADGADQVQGLVDPAVVIEAVVVPALHLQRAQKIFHGVSLECRNGLRGKTKKLALPGGCENVKAV
jgi:hypothetical protein